MSKRAKKGKTNSDDNISSDYDPDEIQPSKKRTTKGRPLEQKKKPSQKKEPYLRSMHPQIVKWYNSGNSVSDIATLCDKQLDFPAGTVTPKEISNFLYTRKKNYNEKLMSVSLKNNNLKADSTDNCMCDYDLTFSNSNWFFFFFFLIFQREKRFEKNSQ